MRVLIAHNRYQRPGGEDAVFEAERDLLKSHGHHVIVYERNNSQIDVSTVHRRADLLRRTVWAHDSVDEIRGILTRENPDIAYFHNTFPLISPGVYSACNSARVPVIQVLPNYRLVCPGATLFRAGRPCDMCIGRGVPWPGIRHACYRDSRAQSAAVVAMLVFHRISRTWSRQVHTYVALTEFARQIFMKGGLPPQKIVVKPNFMSPDPGPSSGDDRYALFSGRLEIGKGLQTLLKAWDRLPDVPLKIAGDGPSISWISEHIESDGRPNVQLLGWRSRDEIIKLMHRASFLVFPSEWYEGFPLTIVEAFACGTPVLGSRQGSVGEIIRDGHSGLLYESGNASALASAVSRVWNDRPLRDKLAAGARLQFEELYTAEANYKQIMTIFNAALSETA